MANAQNSGIVIGRLSKAVAAFQNGDRSRKMMVTLAVPNNYKDAQGNTTTEFVSLEGFVPADKQDGVYGLMHEGDLVAIGYHLKSNNYTDKTSGEQVYGQVCRIDSIELLETKAVTEARAQRKAEEAAKAAEAPAQG